MQQVCFVPQRQNENRHLSRFCDFSVLLCRSSFLQDHWSLITLNSSSTRCLLVQVPSCQHHILRTLSWSEICPKCRFLLINVQTFQFLTLFHRSFSELHAALWPIFLLHYLICLVQASFHRTCPFMRYVKHFQSPLCEKPWLVLNACKRARRYLEPLCSQCACWHITSANRSLTPDPDGNHKLTVEVSDCGTSAPSTKSWRKSLCGAERCDMTADVVPVPKSSHVIPSFHQWETIKTGHDYVQLMLMLMWFLWFKLSETHLKSVRRRWRGGGARREFRNFDEPTWRCFCLYRSLWLVANKVPASSAFCLGPSGSRRCHGSRPAFICPSGQQITSSQMLMNFGCGQ